MDKKKYKQQNNNNNPCWILDNIFKDVLPYFFINLELNDIKNIRLVCRKFQSVIDNNCDRLFNLIFRLKITDVILKEKFQNIIKQNKIINSFHFHGDCLANDALFEYIPNYAKELYLQYYRNINQLKEYKFPLSIESLTLFKCHISLKCLNSIQSSLFYFNCDKTKIIDDNKDYINFEEFPSNLKKLSVNNMYLADLKCWPKNLFHLQLFRVYISSYQMSILQKLNRLYYLELNGIDGIDEINLSNFNSLKTINYHCRQHIYLPSSSKLLQNLILNCNEESRIKTSLPKSLIYFEIHNPQSHLSSYLLKKEHKLPNLKSLSFIYSCALQQLKMEDIVKIINQYDKLQLLIFTHIQNIMNLEDLKIIFNSIHSNINQIQFRYCKQPYTDKIIQLFQNNLYKKIKSQYISNHFDLFFSFTNNK